MAIDSRDKRGRSVGILQPGKVLPSASGSVTPEARAGLAGAYYAGVLEGTSRSIKWASSVCIPCRDCANAEVVLCVNPDKVAPKICTEVAAYHAFSYSTIEAILIKACCIGQCGDRWEYTFTYDDVQIAEGQTLYRQDITGVFCKGCIYSWVQDLVGDEPFVVDNGDGSATYTTRHGCEYDFEPGEGGGFFWPFLYGDGSDGDLVVTGDELLPVFGRNYFFNDVTINAGASLAPLGLYSDNDALAYQIFIKGTLTINGALELDGENGKDAVGRLEGGNTRPMESAAIFIDDGAVGIAHWGRNGGDGGNAANVPQDGSSYYTGSGAYIAGGLGGNGGDGGSGGGVGGEHSQAGQGAYYEAQFFPLRSLHLDLNQIRAFGDGWFGNFWDCVIGGGNAGKGGGGGGFTGSGEGGGGGGGAVSGGFIWVAARNVVINTGGRISANGGNGGNGDDGVAGDGLGGGGGGGGAGGGGCVYLIHDSLTNNGDIEVNGGTKGAGGAGDGGGAAGADGLDGAVGRIYLLNMLTGTFV